MSSNRTPTGGMAEAQSPALLAKSGAIAADQARGGGQEDPAGVLEARMLRPLLAAMHDYTTNDRGDVGSWVRIARTMAVAFTSSSTDALGIIDVSFYQAKELLLMSVEF